MADKKIAFIVTARGGSKGVPNKNIKLLNGLELINYRIKSCLSVELDCDIYLSTDSVVISESVKSAKVLKPFLRNSDLATDEAKCEDAVFEMLSYAQKLHNYQYVCMIQPTSPFTKFSDIENAVKLLDSNRECSALVSSRKVHPSTYYIQENSKFLSDIANRINNHGLLRRQDEKIEVTPSGNFYFSRTEDFLKDKSFYRSDTLNYLVEDPYGLEIDSPLDFEWANFLISTNKINIDKIYNTNIDK